MKLPIAILLFANIQIDKHNALAVNRRYTGAAQNNKDRRI